MGQGTWPSSLSRLMMVSWCAIAGLSEPTCSCSNANVLALRSQLVADVVERQSDVRLDRSTVQVEKRDGTR